MFPVTGCLVSIGCLHIGTKSAIVCSDVVHIPFCQEDEDQTGRLSVSFAAMLWSEGVKNSLSWLHFRLFCLGLCPWDKKPQNRLFFCPGKSQRRGFALELIQWSKKCPASQIQSTAGFCLDYQFFEVTLCWDCSSAGTAVTGSSWWSGCSWCTLHSPALRSSSCYCVHVGGEGSCPVTVKPGPRRWPKTGIWPRAVKWLDQMGNTLSQDEYLLFSTMQSSIISPFFFSVFMWDVKYQGS